MAGRPRTRQSAHHHPHRPPSISSVAAFAATTPGHVVRRPQRIACGLFLILILLTLSALQIGGPQALTELHLASADELNGLVREDPLLGGDGVDKTTGAGGAAPQPLVDSHVEATEADDESAQGEEDPAGLLDGDEGPLSEDEATAEALPVCAKSVLFRFAGLHGFGSEFSLLLRVAAVAGHYGYPVFIDTTSWNYGAWEDYFLPLERPFPPLSALSSSDVPTPPEAACRAPPAETKRYKLALTHQEREALLVQPPSADSAGAAAAAAVPFTPPSWTHRDHLVWHTRDLDGLDATFLRHFADPDQLAATHRDDLELLRRRKTRPPFLSPQRTLPAVHEPAFVRLSQLAAAAWRPNGFVTDLTEEVESALLRPPPQQSGTGKSPGALLVGVHVRLGDKFLETDRIGPVAFAPEAAALDGASTSSSSSTRGLHPDLLTSYYAAAIDSIHSLLSLPSITPVFSSAAANRSARDRVRALMSATKEWAVEDPEERPTLALMSDDEGAVERFRAHPLAVRFRIVGTGEKTVQATGTSTSTSIGTEQAGEESEPETGAAEDEEEGGVEDDRPQGGLREEVEPGPFEEEEAEQEDEQSGEEEEQPLADDAAELVAADDEGLDDARRLRRRAAVAQPTTVGRPDARKQKKKKGKPGKKRQVGKIPAGFSETKFNSLPLAARIAAARVFVRDLTLLSQHADALVVTGSSNVGRLMMLLFEAATAARDRQEEGEEADGPGGGVQRKRELRSLDARWFPTARFS